MEHLQREEPFSSDPYFSIPNGLYSGTSFDGTSTVYVLVEILPPHAQICVLSKEMGGNQNIWHSFKVLNNIDVHWTLQKKKIIFQICDTFFWQDIG